jgi:hypothetical protein
MNPAAFGILFTVFGTLVALMFRSIAKDMTRSEWKALGATIGMFAFIVATAMFLRWAVEMPVGFGLILGFVFFCGFWACIPDELTLKRARLAEKKTEETEPVPTVEAAEPEIEIINFDALLVRNKDVIDQMVELGMKKHRQELEAFDRLLND